MAQTNTIRHIRNDPSDLSPGVVFEVIGDDSLAAAMGSLLSTFNPAKSVLQAVAADPIDAGFLHLSDCGRPHGVYFGFMGNNGAWSQYGWIREGEPQAEV